MIESAAEVASSEPLGVGGGRQCAAGATDGERAVDTGAGGVDFCEAGAGHCDAGDVGEVSSATGGQGKGAVGQDHSGEGAVSNPDTDVVCGVANGAGITDEGLQSGSGQQDFAAGSASACFDHKVAGEVGDAGGERGVVGRDADEGAGGQADGDVLAVDVDGFADG